MKPLLFTVISCLVGIAGLVGCTSHHYRIDDGFVSFYLESNDAKTVEFRCSADDFRTHEARRISRKTWEIRVPADRDFSYFYLVDGKVHVPSCPLKEKDDFGQENCLFTLDM